MEETILRFFESIRCIPLTVVFAAFSVFGEAIVVAVFVILADWLASRRVGEQIAVAALTSIPVNSCLKIAVGRPRPYVKGVVSRLEVDSPVFSTTEAELGNFLSFPSGHAQVTSNFLASVCMKAKKVWPWFASILFILLVMCSRLYFGVHYPTDLIGGFLIGVAIAVIWQIIYRFCYGARYFVLCGLAVLALVPFLFFTHEDYEQAAGLITGAAVFLPLVNYVVKPQDTPFPRRLWRVPAGILVAGIAFAALLFFPEAPGYPLLKWFLFTGAATFGAQGFFRLLKI